MRKLYDKFFRVQDGEPIREKVLYARIAVYVSFVVILMAAMSFAAFGYFTSDVESGANQIATASYTLDIEVLSGTDNLYSGTDPVTLAPGQYTVTLSYVEGSSSTGFCKIKFGDQCYHTLQIGADENAENGFRQKVSLTLIVQQETSVTFEPSWGTSVYYGSADPCYLQGDTLTIV